MTSLLQDQLRPASFRGVPFQVDDADLEAGRRTQLHEYPKRDRPYTEDLGRATRTQSVSGFVIGPDYIEQAERLLAALEQSGPGTLVHPWLGTMQVTVGVARVRYSASGLGMATFDIPFVEAGELSFPSVQTSTQAQSRIAADVLTSASVGDFAQNFSVKGAADFVVDGAVSSIQDVTKLLSVPVPGMEVLGYAERLSGLSQSLVDLVAHPTTLALQLTSALGLAGLAGIDTRWVNVAQSLARLAGSAGLVDPMVPAVRTASRQQAWQNDKAINGLARRSLLTQAIGASSVMQASIYDDVLVVRNVLTAALDAEALTAGDQVFAALQAARAAVWADLTERGRSAARLKVYRPNIPMPALALAYQLYGDAGRADEITIRNQVRHPGFVPALPLQVLTQ